IDAWCIVWSGAPMTRRKASVGRAWSGTVVVPSRVVIEIWLPFADGGSVVVVVVAPIVVVVGAPVVVVVPTIVVLVVPPIVVVVDSVRNHTPKLAARGGCTSPLPLICMSVSVDRSNVKARLPVVPFSSGSPVQMKLMWFADDASSATG